MISGRLDGEGEEGMSAVPWRLAQGLRHAAVT